MVHAGWLPGRVVAGSLVAIVLLATGGASGILLEGEPLAGHTAYVAAVVAAPGPRAADPSPLVYGLATLQDTYLFGLIVRPRVLDESADRMVFAWTENGPDPRGDPTLALTGEHARIRDRAGLVWTVLEFRYDGAGSGATPSDGPHHAYGVRVGDIETLPDGTRYNHVLTYRPERLAPAAFAEPDTTPAPALLRVPVARGVGPIPDAVSDSPPPGIGWETLARLG